MTHDHEDNESLKLEAESRMPWEDYVDDADLRSLAEDIVRFSPGLTQLLLALGPANRDNPLRGLN